MHRIIDTPLWGVIKTREQYTGWLALIFGLTLTIGNPKNILWRIAEHGTARGTWAAVFMLIGLALVLAPHWRVRRAHFVLCVGSAFFWGYFGMQSYSIEAIGAAMMALLAMIYMGLTAMVLYQGED